MTAKEIQDSHSHMPELWIKEIAYQLAVMNERNADLATALNVALCATNDDIPVRLKTS